MKKVRFSDWQEMALKKDVEYIKQKLNTQEPILLSLIWEIVVALGSIIVDHLFDTEKAPSWVWIVVIISAVIPPIIILIYKISCWVKRISSVKKGKLKIRSYVDMFDNQISYWVMLSNSYADMLSEVVNDPVTKTSFAEKEFLYREGCYYNNKSMQALYSMKSNFDKIFNSDLNEVKKNNIIDLARLENLLSLMNKQQCQLDKDIDSIGEAKTEGNGISKQKEMNKKYTEELNKLINDLNKVFGIGFVWINNCEEKGET